MPVCWTVGRSVTLQGKSRLLDQREGLAWLTRETLKATRNVVAGWSGCFAATCFMFAGRICRTAAIHLFGSSSLEQQCGRRMNPPVKAVRQGRDEPMDY